MPIKFLTKLLKAKLLRDKLKKQNIHVKPKPLASSYQFTFEEGVALQHVACKSRGGSFRIGADSYWQSGSAIGSISIGRFCSIGSNVTIGLIKDSHPTDWLSSSSAQYSNSALCKARSTEKLSYEPELKPTIISSDVWIGNQVTVMNGLKIGVGAIIATGAVVVKSVPDYAIVAGVPAEVVKFRFNQDIITRLLDSEWWMLESSFLANLPFSSVDKCLSLLEEENKDKNGELFDGVNYKTLSIKGIK